MECLFGVFLGHDLVHLSFHFQVLWPGIIVINRGCWCSSMCFRTSLAFEVQLYMLDIARRQRELWLDAQDGGDGPPPPVLARMAHPPFPLDPLGAMPDAAGGGAPPAAQPLAPPRPPAGGAVGAGRAGAAAASAGAAPAPAGAWAATEGRARAGAEGR